MSTTDRSDTLTGSIAQWVLVAVVLWAARAAVSNDGYFPRAPIAVALDLALLAVQWIALSRAQERHPGIGGAGSPSRLLFMPAAFALVLLVLDIVRIFES